MKKLYEYTCLECGATFTAESEEQLIEVMRLHFELARWLKRYIIQEKKEV